MTESNHLSQVPYGANEARLSMTNSTAGQSKLLYDELGPETVNNAV